MRPGLAVRGRLLDHGNEREEGGGLEQRPEHQTIRTPGLTPAALHIRLLRDRPARPLRTIRADEIPAVFARADADETSWRKGRGLSSDEVRRAALERSA